jgi:iron-sulfur cluster repair protein YtfE (RIC family)
MFRFTDLIDAHHAIEDVVARYPATGDVFETNGIRRCCWSCSIRAAAWRGGLDLSLLLDELNRAASERACGVEA